MRVIQKIMQSIILFHNHYLHGHEIWQVDKTICLLQGDISLMMSLLLTSSMHGVADISEDMVVMFSSEEQCIYSKFEFYQKKNAWEIHVALQEVCGNSAFFLFTSCQINWL